ncbi:aspartate-semialdehyde dehydrogenase [Gilliamella sp. Pas-s27]|uniref:aspartate-semialdehyde dehydrogenase n=1 Tax=Gilliamella sp. Pas-s27 TaxID=2687311 RepID=UPI001365657A|nr:aspartate-semialdehyde dehydrogenase [Gilliamella sp. Pas-s27]MWP46580.1 aspartate-semialdehyde dehydrogenase [Gilliamella sp. Pas-s27]
MSAWNIAIVGATGQVGSALVELLQQRGLQDNNLKIENLYLVGSDNSAGEIVRFSGKNLTVIDSAQMDWSECHFAFFVAGAKTSEKYAQVAAEAGCVVIDASGYFAEQDHIPLVVPKVNNSVLTEYRNENIIAVASATVCQLLRCVASLTDMALLTNLHVTSFIPASLYGKSGVDELAGQSARLLNGMPVDNQLFDKQLAFNLLPISHEQDDAILGEKSQVNQIRKVLSNYELPVSIESVIVPVFYGVSQAINVSSSLPIELDMARFGEFGVEVQGDNLPTPVTEVSTESESQLTIKLANLRHSYGHYEQIQFWSVADNIRYLGALMLIETLEILINDYI